MSLLPFFTWCEATWLGEALRGSKWLFPVIESFHLLALAVIGGAVLLVNLRLCGLGVKTPATQLWRDTMPWFTGSLAVLIVSGMLLFTSEAIKLYYSDAFWVKMGSLSLALLFTFTVLRRVALAGESKVNPLWSKAVAIVSLLLWTGVGASGRWIGFS